MPRTKIDYLNTVMYKIVCNDLDVKDFYVGHTTDFKGRKCCHKNASENKNHRDRENKLYSTINLYGGWINWNMIE